MRIRCNITDKTTLNYYNVHAQDFVQDTVAVDFSITQDRFLAQLEKGASILDFGCGSGQPVSKKPKVS